MLLKLWSTYMCDGSFIFHPLFKGPSYPFGQAVLWLHPWHHSDHPCCTHQQLWNYQAAGAEGSVDASAAWGGFTKPLFMLQCVFFCLNAFNLSPLKGCYLLCKYMHEWRLIMNHCAFNVGMSYPDMAGCGFYNRFRACFARPEHDPWLNTERPH